MKNHFSRTSKADCGGTIILAHLVHHLIIFPHVDKAISIQMRAGRTILSFPRVSKDVYWISFTHLASTTSVAILYVITWPVTKRHRAVTPGVCRLFKTQFGKSQNSNNGRLTDES
ncbi:hypothetical protein K503DRAFT_83213 [Rhizopogon vinicolor AM-OR11-026]|uniref:Uncharacterized protein n=1 Tax=Rhizopogon vinicolor AM-OR11-026 TaxID=1314800 RepID=A0A1B7N3P8_9AGAM|nr:hypothetical protein K503DRAFT_83213 [Rhizopogon vinicolor AM-OR11-026]